jgi:hypothetical protein
MAIGLLGRARNPPSPPVSFAPEFGQLSASRPRRQTALTDVPQRWRPSQREGRNARSRAKTRVASGGGGIRTLCGGVTPTTVSRPPRSTTPAPLPRSLRGLRRVAALGFAARFRLCASTTMQGSGYAIGDPCSGGFGQDFGQSGRRAMTRFLREPATTAAASERWVPPPRGGFPCCRAAR